MRKMSKFALKKVASITTDLYYPILEEQNFLKKRENRPKLLKKVYICWITPVLGDLDQFWENTNFAIFAIFGKTALLSVLIGTIEPRYTFNLIFHLFCLIFSVRDSAYARSCARCLSNRIFLKNVKNAPDWPKIVFYCRKTPISGDLDRFRENTKFANLRFLARQHCWVYSLVL